MLSIKLIRVLNLEAGHKPPLEEKQDSCNDPKFTSASMIATNTHFNTYNAYSSPDFYRMQGLICWRSVQAIQISTLWHSKKLCSPMKSWEGLVMLRQAGAPSPHFLQRRQQTNIASYVHEQCSYVICFSVTECVKHKFGKGTMKEYASSILKKCNQKCLDRGSPNKGIKRD